MKRALLVAVREYIENVRTKGFWIGILMLPVILVMVGIVPVLVESTRSAKLYAVVDESALRGASGVLAAVDRLIDEQDFNKLLRDYDLDDGNSDGSIPASLIQRAKASRK